MGALRHGLLLLTTALLLSGIVFAQNHDAAEFSAGGNGGVQTKDLEFMSRAAQEGMARFHLAYVALQNAQSEEVKALARQVVADYYKSQGELIDIANQQFIALPTAIDAKDQATLDSLLQLHGEAFDKAYIQATLNGHRMDLAQFKNEAKSGNNQAIANWANQNVSSLEIQFKQAEKVAPTVGVETTEKKDKTKSDTASQKPQ
jgi:putative membrane protein